METTSQAAAIPVPIRFGTDGVRGVANVDLTPEVAVALGRAAVAVLRADRWLIGADTRASSPMLVAALASGLAAAGADVVDLGVAPTPAVAFHAQLLGIPAAVVSASHNPYTDNGIKLLAPGGRKLGDAVEEAIAATISGNMSRPRPAVIGGVGRIDHHGGPLPAYGAHVVASIDGRRLEGMHVVIDCANGAAGVVAPDVLRQLGAQVTVLHAAPDGTNINAGCGSTHPGSLQAAVVAAGADAGLAFDGDADRVLAVSGDGTLVDGDRILVMCAIDLHRRGRLRNDCVAVTVMSNLGLRLALGTAGIDVVETPVGDRYVVEAMETGDLVLGGEQSGHVIFRDLATTGDGLLTGVQLLDLVVRSGGSLASLASGAMTGFPQVLRNVRVEERAGAASSPSVNAAVAAARAELGSTGRVLLRASGTEPLVRVMVEAPTVEQARAVADRLSEVVAQPIGSPTP